MSITNNVFAFVVSGFLIFLHSCHKETISTQITNQQITGINNSFAEEFDTVFHLKSKGWMIRNLSDITSQNGMNGTWQQGRYGRDKAGHYLGFPAFSFTVTPDEFIYATVSSIQFPTPPANFTISSWLITPALSVKNGDRFSFYTRADTGSLYTDRLQVRMNSSKLVDIGNSNSSVGNFNTVLFDINSVQATNTYPATWTKFEYVFTGIRGTIETRIAFRYYVTYGKQARGIGIDLFRFEKL